MSPETGLPAGRDLKEDGLEAVLADFIDGLVVTDRADTDDIELLVEHAEVDVQRLFWLKAVRILLLIEPLLLLFREPFANESIDSDSIGGGKTDIRGDKLSLLNTDDKSGEFEIDGDLRDIICPEPGALPDPLA